MITKCCPSYLGYSASEDGEVFSHRRRGNKNFGMWGGTSVNIDYSYSRRIKGYKTKKGYIIAGMKLNNRAFSIGLHQLVADAFHGPRPKGMQVRHLDGDVSNNHFSNLAYGTIFENNQDRVRHGTYTSGADHHSAKLSYLEAAKIRELRARKTKVKVIATMFSVSISTIESIIYNKSYKVLSTTGKPTNNPTP